MDFGRFNSYRNRLRVMTAIFVVFVIFALKLLGRILLMSCDFGEFDDLDENCFW